MNNIRIDLSYDLAIVKLKLRKCEMMNTLNLFNFEGLLYILYVIAYSFIWAWNWKNDNDDEDIGLKFNDVKTALGNPNALVTFDWKCTIPQWYLL